MRCLVGLDDTDSARGLCTTYLGYRIATDLSLTLEVLPYPRLVRLNPNVPFKTRGNAAISMLIETEDPLEAFGALSSHVARFSDLANGANPGMVFLSDIRLASGFREVYLAAVSGMVNRHRVLGFLRDRGVRTFSLGNGMGLVGAAAAIGFDEAFDHTYELICYRAERMWGSRRLLHPESVKEMDADSFPRTYNNYDYQKKKVLIAPGGPDPVFCGIRGDSPQSVLGALSRIRASESLQGHMIYVSNQYTDAHLSNQVERKSFSSGWAEGLVSRVAVGPGGHCYFSIRSSSDEIRCAVYAPTGDLCRVAASLLPGDLVRAYGGVRKPSETKPSVLNVEKLTLLKLRTMRQVANPRCPSCGKRMSSGGVGQGYRCRSCGTRAGVKARANSVVRTLVPGTYAPSPRANRHLSKPLVRLGRECAGVPSISVEGWLSGGLTAMQGLS